MNKIAFSNSDRPGSQTPAIDLTALARRAELAFATSVSPGIAELYGLSFTTEPLERDDLRDLVWSVSCALNGRAPSRPWVSDWGQALLVEFPSFIEGFADAKTVQVIATLRESPNGRKRLYLSRLEEDVPAIKPLVLVAEDDALLARLVRARLRGEGFDAMSIGTGAETLAYAAEYQPDVILLDVDLPDCHGFEICSRLRTEDGTKGLPVVIVSGWHGAGELAAKAGAKGYLEKPLGYGGLADHLRRALAADKPAGSGGGGPLIAS